MLGLIARDAGRTRRRWLNPLLAASLRCLAMAGAFCTYRAACGEDAPLSKGTVIRFAEVHEGISALTRYDEYIRQMSPFDRQVRLQTDRDVSEEQLLAFIGRNVIPWTEDDVRRLKPLLEEMAKKLAPWKLDLPAEVLLVKTTGQEEARAAYCRGAAIVLPENMVSMDFKQLQRVLPHELFHVASSNNPELREALYEVVGFHLCNEVQLPEPLRARKITNPDAPVNNHYIRVIHDGRPMELMPVLFSKSPRYDAKRGGGLFNYLEFRLMSLSNDNGTRRAELVDGQPVLLPPKSVTGFMEQVGRNTNYLIHPEEILADNFVFVIDGRIDLPTQRIIQEMGKVMMGKDEG